MKRDQIAWILRYFSNRGTDHRICVMLPDSTTDSEALEIAKEWAEKDTAGTACHEYMVEVEQCKLLSEKEWQKQWKAACKAKNEADEIWNNLRAIRTAYDWRSL